jgi:hypothetical protein
MLPIVLGIRLIGVYELLIAGWGDGGAVATVPRPDRVWVTVVDTEHNKSERNMFL